MYMYICVYKGRDTESVNGGSKGYFVLRLLGYGKVENLGLLIIQIIVLAGNLGLIGAIRIFGNDFGLRS